MLMFENIKSIFKRTKKVEMLTPSSKDAAKERLHLVLVQDRANVSSDFLDLMRDEIIEVIKKYIEIDEASMDVRLTTEVGEDGVQGVPALYANIPIVNIKEDTRKLSKANQENSTKETEPPTIIELKEDIKNEEKKDEEIKEVKNEQKKPKKNKKSKEEKDIIEENEVNNVDKKIESEEEKKDDK